MRAEVMGQIRDVAADKMIVPNAPYRWPAPSAAVGGE
jgi:hypothetical protein